MWKPPIDLDKNIHCQELNSPNHFTGLFVITDESIETSLFSYDRFLLLDLSGPVFLKTENAKYISLYSNVETQRGRDAAHADQPTIVHHQKFLSNSAIVGPDIWKENDLIRVVVFNIGNTGHILRNHEILKGLSKFEDSKPVIRLDMSNLSIRIGFACSYELYFDDPKEYWPEFEIEFHQGVSSLECFEAISALVHLFSAAVGIYLEPTNIRIRRLSEEQYLLAVEDGKFNGDHWIFYPKTRKKVDTSRLWAGHAFIHALDEVELSAMKDVIRVWFERLSIWRSSNNLMMSAFSMEGEIGGRRLLNACSWLEEMPGTMLKRAINEENIEEILNAACKKANELGYFNLQSRIRGGLRSIGTETNQERYTRLTNDVKDRFGNALDKEALVHLMRAIKLRGKAAHSHFVLENDEEFGQLAKSIFAMEALCFLLMLKDLPLTKQGFQRGGANPMVQSYRHCPSG